MKSNVILLVEDDYVDIMNVERGLKKLKANYTLHIAHNGVDALALLNGNVPGEQTILPDIILLDINMPKMNGVEFLRIIKNYYTLNSIKIFVTTTSVEEYDKLSTEQLGINGYIVKPLKFEPAKPGQSDSMSKLLMELI